MVFCLSLQMASGDFRQMEPLSIDETEISPTVTKCMLEMQWDFTDENEQKIDDDVIKSVARIDNIIVHYSKRVVHKISVFYKLSDDTDIGHEIGECDIECTDALTKTINFHREEYITCVRGTIGSISRMWGCCVTSIQITTNHNVYELLGDHNNVLDVFVFRPDGRTIIGFHGYSGSETIKAIGVYVKDEVKHLRQQLAEEARLRLQAREDFRKMCNENKALKRMAKEHDKFRNWIEHAKSSDSSVDRFENFKLPPYDSVEDCLGGGAYGNVYRAEMKTAFAIKIRINGSWQGDRQFDQEIEVLRKIRHPNLVSLIGACKKNYALVYEYLPNGNLQQLLAKSKQRREVLSWSERTKIAASICSTLVFLHKTEPNPIAHGDLKPENILFDSNNVCKLCDFGISRYLENVTEKGTPYHKTEEYKGTYGYMDPEYEKTRRLTPQSDVYAFGIILLQLVTGEVEDVLRDRVLNQIGSLENFIGKSKSQQREILEQFPDVNLEGWPIDEVVKMTSLGIRCSDPVKENRPRLEKVVWVEIVNGFASIDN